MSAATNASRRSGSSGWSFTLRKHASDAHSDSSSHQSEGAEAEADCMILTEEEKLLKDLDLSSRQDFAEYRPNPWSIAKVNASTRKYNPSLQLQPSLNAPKQIPPKKPQGLIVDAFRKQISKALPQDATTQLTNISSRAHPIRKKVQTGRSGSRIPDAHSGSVSCSLAPSDFVSCPLAPSDVASLNAPLVKRTRDHLQPDSKTISPALSPSLVGHSLSPNSGVHTLGAAATVNQEPSLIMSSNQRPTIAVDLTYMALEKDVDIVADSLQTVSDTDRTNTHAVATLSSFEIPNHRQGHILRMAFSFDFPSFNVTDLIDSSQLVNPLSFVFLPFMNLSALRHLASILLHTP